MRYFLEYLKRNNDDSPLYVFDSRFDENSETKLLLTDYSVPSYFQEDIFKLVGERRRPPYRWFLVGPARSGRYLFKIVQRCRYRNDMFAGTCVHIDPLGTSAWNTVIRGRKRWVLFPPATPKSVSSLWFLFTYSI